MTTATELAALFLESSRNTLLGEYWPRLRECVSPLTTEQIWWRPNDARNSIGNLLLHLNGNVGQWLVASFNKDEDRRDRPAEFAAQSGLTAAELLERLGATLDEAGKVLDRLTVDELLAPCEIQGYHTRGLMPSITSWSTSGCTTDKFSTSRRAQTAQRSWFLQRAEQDRPGLRIPGRGHFHGLRSARPRVECPGNRAVNSMSC